MERDRIGLGQERESSRAIEAEAARWVARLDRGPLSLQDQAQLDGWLAGDARRLGAYARLSALSWRTERSQVLAENDVFEPTRATPVWEKHAHGLSRRRLLAGGGVAAAACAVGGVAVWAGSGGTAYATAVGEVRRIPLDDVTTATLNTDTHLRVKRGGQVELQRGEALFEVGGEGDGAFRLALDQMRASTVGATFVARRFTDGAMTLIVREGNLRLTHARDAFAPVRLRQGFAARLDAGRDAQLRVEAVEPGLVERALAWRDGELAFADDTLAFAVAEFARYGGPPIVIADPTLSRRTISGWFPARDPVAFATAAAAVFDAQVAVRADRIVLEPR